MFPLQAGVAQRVGRGIALLVHDRDIEGVSGQKHDPATLYIQVRLDTIVQEAGWAPCSKLDERKISPHRDSIPDRPALSQSLDQMRYPAHIYIYIYINIYIQVLFCTYIY